MFDLFSWSHILILLVVALVVVGPKDLPKLMRTAGEWTGRARAMANEFRKSFDEMARQSELDELRKEIEALRTDRPLSAVERDLHQAIVPDDMRSGDVMTPLAPQPPQVQSPEPPPEPPIDHSKVDEEPLLPDPDAATDVLKGPPAP